ncbi:carboxypeptidase-like regulatory domain-containing protein [Microlunatus speluncae]|uniref:carboxypeptidase-like regulatory domain-containing protein n=1 Tax=Microlunatus speluncae TaxID=2594267 RepID=UPI00126627E3|nr:carboxypeptidase-like regulatory domain-containing protein [Microlunatus speluncae]
MDLDQLTAPAAAPGPVESASAELIGWLSTVTGSLVQPTRPTGPTPEQPEPALFAWPIGLLPEPEARPVGVRPPFRFRVRHLVLAVGPDQPAARLLDRVLIAAVQPGAPEVRLDPLPADLWTAIGLAPRPVLIFDVAAQVARIVPEPALVRRPLRIEDTAIRALRGTIIGPEDVPMADLRVEVTTTGAYAHTNSRGEFGISNVPAQDRIRLRISGKGRRYETEVDSRGTDHPIIRFDLEEV